MKFYAEVELDDKIYDELYDSPWVHWYMSVDNLTIHYEGEYDEEIECKKTKHCILDLSHLQPIQDSSETEILNMLKILNKKIDEILGEEE